MGLAADIGTLAYLPKIAGNMSLVREFCYTSQTFSAAVAEKMGLLSSVIEGGREDVVGAALELAKAIASKSPVAVAGTKHIISHALDNSIAANLDYTAIWNGGALQTRVGLDFVCLPSRPLSLFLKYRISLRTCLL